jgi:hypothetical protein
MLKNGDLAGSSPLNILSPLPKNLESVETAANFNVIQGHRLLPSSPIRNVELATNY